MPRVVLGKQYDGEEETHGVTGRNITCWSSLGISCSRATSLGGKAEHLQNGWAPGILLPPHLGSPSGTLNQHLCSSAAESNPAQPTGLRLLGWDQGRMGNLRDQRPTS